MEWVTDFVAELGTLHFWSSLLTIVFIDLLLAGDNAIVIGLAARNLPKESQKKAIMLGTVGAVGIRVIATVVVVWLLKIPFLLAIGGVVLLWIAYKLLVQEDKHEDVKPAATLMASIRTIVIADAAMGLDNVIAVAGAAHGSIELVVLGLLVSIPIVVWGSTLFIKIIDRYAWIIYIGSGVLAYTAAKMITHEKRFEEWFGGNPALTWTFYAAMVVIVLAAGYWTNAVKSRRSQAARQAARDREQSGEQAL
ncbi:TerC family protein [Cohnella caldifontis]|uniref:TerC family protein n=1 Tax=Cohnella caldifontis TaxID=3027471 RepID=UPI0023ECBB91|nr:TerC family protein [Cohnella sp. YIM B05605]